MVDSFSEAIFGDSPNVTPVILYWLYSSTEGLYKDASPSRIFEAFMAACNRCSDSPHFERRFLHAIKKLQKWVSVSPSDQQLLLSFSKPLLSARGQDILTLFFIEQKKKEDDVEIANLAICDADKRLVMLKRIKSEEFAKALTLIDANDFKAVVPDEFLEKKHNLNTTRCTNFRYRD